MIAINLSKQQELDADTANQFYCKSRWRRRHNNVFIIEEAKEIILDFSQGMLKYCNFILFYYNINTK